MGRSRSRNIYLDYFKAYLPVKKRPTAELLTIGTELLTGSTVNTNAAYLGKELTSLGFKVHHQCAVRDEPDVIKGALGQALRRSDVIVITGGLGPTPDDITRETVADYFRVPLLFFPKQYQLIKRLYRLRGKQVPAIVKKEAYFPSNAKPVLNQFGVALGFTIEEEGKMVIVLPGVPGELIRLFETRIKNFLPKKFKADPIYGLVVKTIGLSEPAVMQRLGNGFFDLGSFQFGIYPKAGEVSLRMYADSKPLISKIKNWVKRKLRGSIYSFGDETLEQVVARELKKQKMTISLAESCTGGRISKKITAIAGASAFFKGSVVAYHDRAKHDLIEVQKDILRDKGAVSKECALAMARGVKKKMNTRLGISVTGIAGPSGGTKEKPVGLVYISISGPKEEKVWKHLFTGDRDQIQSKATKKTLEYLWRWTQKKSEPF